MEKNPRKALLISLSHRNVRTLESSRYTPNTTGKLIKH